MSSAEHWPFWPGRLRQQGAPATPALPAPGTAKEAGPPPDPLVEEFEKLVGQLRDAARTAGVGRDDPMMPLLSAFAQMIRFIGTRTASSNKTVADASQRITDALLTAKSAADAERDRFQADLAAAEAATIQRVGNAIARSADAALTRRVRVFDRNTALLAALALVLTAGAGLGGGYWWGSSTANAGIHQTEAGLRAAFNESPADAAIWLDLMTWNRIRGGLAQCASANLITTQDGRRKCDVPLWIEKPQPTTPNQQR